MSKIGIIFVGYQCEDLLGSSLAPWIEARRTRLGGHDYSICAVSVPFVGFDHGGDKLDATRAALVKHYNQRDIDRCVIGEVPVAETEARGAALTWLRDVANVDTLIQWDSDEIPTTHDVLRIVNFVELNPWVPTFRISYRNAVFSKTTFMEDAFIPMRIHQVRLPDGFVADFFWEDNNVMYRHPVTKELKRDLQLANLTIPAAVAHPVHWTWLNDERSRRKIAYQEGRGWSCSFRWDEVTGLQFNEAYYARLGQSVPKLVSA